METAGYYIADIGWFGLVGNGKDTSGLEDPLQITYNTDKTYEYTNVA